MHYINELTIFFFLSY